MHIGELLFPAKCPICGIILRRREQRICHTCRKSLPRVYEPMCARCGKPIAKADGEYCFDCGRKRLRRDVLIKGTALWRYDEQMKKVMAAFKYNGCSEDAKIFAEEFSRFRGGQIHTWGPEVIVPVPLHWRRRWFRGYNQAECLALELGNVMRIPVRTDILMRTRYTKPQKVLDDKERRQNLQEAFCVPDKIRDVVRSFQRVLLVDDIYTTGATIESCASVLHECGVREIYFACLCIGRDYEIS